MAHSRAVVNTRAQAVGRPAIGRPLLVLVVLAIVLLAVGGWVIQAVKAAA